MCKNKIQSQNHKQTVQETKGAVRDGRSGEFISRPRSTDSDISKLSEKAKVPNGSITNRKK